MVDEDDVARLFELLFVKDNKVAYGALQDLQKISENTELVYPYMDRLGDMLDSDSSYIRTRALNLIAHNARWDEDCKIDEIIDAYLKHVEDEKPITARQCIKLLPVIAEAKPELREDITGALRNANVCIYGESMRPLIYKDIKEALIEIEEL